MIVPPPGYFQEVRRLCTEAGALLVLDEMQTAFGRCGTFFAHEQFGITPDLVCVGKAFGGGMLPLSAVLGTEEVWTVLRELPSTFGSSLGGNPLSCRVGLESIAIASDEAFLAGVRERAVVIGQRLGAAAQRHPGVLAAHRGLGMMHGLEFHDEATAGHVLGRLLEEGITSTYSLYNPRVLRVQPPMVIAADELAHCLAVLDTLLAETEALGDATGGGPGVTLSPVSRTVRLPHSVRDVLDALHAAPRALDPFAADGTRAPAGGDPEFTGRLGADTVVWTDHVDLTGQGVRLWAEPGWLWRTLERETRVEPDGADGSVLHVRVTWDTDSAGYEDMVGGRIGFFVERGLTERLAAFRTALPEPARNPA